MKQPGFNESAVDADIRDKSLWTDEKLDIQITRKAKRLKSAQDGFEEQQLQRELDIGEDDE